MYPSPAVAFVALLSWRLIYPRCCSSELMQALYIFFHFYGMRVLKQNCVTNILPELKMPSGIIVHLQKYKQIQICADKNKSQDLEHLIYLHLMFPGIWDTRNVSVSSLDKWFLIWKINRNDFLKSETLCWVCFLQWGCGIHQLLQIWSFHKNPWLLHVNKA